MLVVDKKVGLQGLMKPVNADVSYSCHFSYFSGGEKRPPEINLCSQAKVGAILILLYFTSSVVTCHQYGISAVFRQTLFQKETSCDIVKVSATFSGYLGIGLSPCPPKKPGYNRVPPPSPRTSQYLFYH